MSRKKLIRDHYEPLISPNRPGFQVADWACAADQVIRFQVLVENVDLSGKSLLDVGCGTGDVVDFLGQRRVNVDYTGVDLLERIAHEASARHPKECFCCADLFSAAPLKEQSFDVVFCSGIFNLNVGNNQAFLTDALPKLMALTRETLVVNLLHVNTPFQFRQCAYFDPADVLSILAPLPCSVHLLDDYLPHDFTVLCRRNTHCSSTRFRIK